MNGAPQVNFHLPDDTVLCLDARMSGTGSASCGPYLREEYRLDGGRIAFRCALHFGK